MPRQNTMVSKPRPVLAFVTNRRPCRESPIKTLLDMTGMYAEENGLLDVSRNQNGSPVCVVTRTPLCRRVKKLGFNGRFSLKTDSVRKALFSDGYVDCCFFASDSFEYKREKRKLQSNDVERQEGKRPRIDEQDILKRLPLLDCSQKGFSDVEITVERLEEWINRLRRSMSQKRVMREVSANDYMSSFGEKSGIYDWLHLFAHSIGGYDGKNPQIEENLVAGTHACNMQMFTFAEKVLKDLILKHKLSGVRLTVIASLKEVDGKYTHIATKISYCIKYKCNSAIFEFDPFDDKCVIPWRHSSIMGKLFENVFLEEQKENLFVNSCNPS